MRGRTRSRLSIQQSVALWGSACDRISAVRLCASGRSEYQREKRRKRGKGGVGEAAFAQR